MDLLKRFGRARDGNIAIMFGLFLVPTLAGAGIAVDFVRANAVRSALVEAADSGVLAAARARLLDGSLTETQASAIARRYFDANQDGADVEIDSFSFQFDEDTERYTLNITGRVRTAILGVIGNDFVPLSIRSSANASTPGPVEVALVLDNTGSMSGDKIKALRKSARDLVDILLKDDSGDFKVALVPFAQYVNVGTVNAGETWVTVPPGAVGDVWNGCVGSRNFPANIDDGLFLSNPAPGVLNVDCPQAINPLTAERTEIIPKINNMGAAGSTYIPGGLTWGRRVLSNAEPFTEGLSDAQSASQNGLKAIVLLTDGANTRAPSYPAHDVKDQAAADTLTDEMCRDLAQDDFRIYAIAFEVSDPTTEALMRNCATEDGGYFDADNPTLLAAAFSAIATDLVNLALSE